jgi:multiple sugar transport system substrate-binding protein
MKKRSSLIFILLLTAAVLCFAIGEQEGAADEGPKIVKILHVSSPEADHLAANIAAFEAATGIEAQIDLTPQQVIQERLVREFMEGGGNYDVVVAAGIEQSTAFLSKGGIIPIEDYLSKEEVELQYARRTFTDPRTGKMAGVAQFNNNQMLFYRKDLLEDPAEQAAFQKKYGRKLTPPATMEELAEVAEFFHRPPDMYGYFVSGVEWSWFSDMRYFAFAEGETFGDPQGNLKLNSPGMVKAMTNFVKMSEFAPPGWEGLTFFDGDELIKEGKLFMYMNWSYIWKTFYETMPDKIGMAPPVAGKEPGVALGGYLALIPENAPNLEAAVEFMKWLSGYDYQKKMALDMTGNLPSRSDVLNDPEVRAASPGIEQFEQVLPYAHATKVIWRAEMRSGLYEVFFKILKGETTPKEGLDWVQNVKFAGRKAVE